MMGGRRRREISAVITFAVVGLALRIAWAVWIAPRQGSDARWYSQMALSLAAGGDYQNAGLPTAYYPVGYPASLAFCHVLFGRAETVARLANALFGLGTLLGIYGVARALARSRITALLALLCFVIYPADIGFTSVTLSQVLFNTWALLGCALCLGSSATSLFVGGLLLGCATLTRVQGVVLWPLMIAVWFTTRTLDRRWSRALWMSLGFVAAVAPWTVRNALAFHAFVPVATNGGINLYIGNNPRARGHYYYSPKIDAPIAAAIKGPRRGGPNEISVDRLARHLAWQYASEHPYEALRLWRAKFDYLYDSDAAFADWSHKLSDERSVAWVQRMKRLDQIYYPFLLWLGGLGAIVASLEMARSRSGLWLPALVILAFTGLHMLTFGDPSYHHPMMPWFAIYTGHGLSAPWRYRTRANWLPRRVDAA